MTKSPYRMFYCQRWDALNRRHIPWNMSFEEWWHIWQESGHWEERGSGTGKYCMARFGDKGGYESGNVSIILHVQNIKDGISGKPSKLKGTKKSKEVRARMSRAQMGNTKATVHKGRVLSDEWKRKLSIARKRYLANAAA